MKNPKNLKEALAKKLTQKQLALLPRAFDIIGSKEKMVIIVEISPQLEKYKKIIAKTLMSLHKNAKTVLRKLSGRRGKYRLIRYELLAGDKNTEVIHKEYGCVFKCDPQKVYFSPRESTERQRIAELVRQNERVLVMFSGVCPYPITIAKKQPKVKEICAVEWNPAACKYATENVRMNKLSDKIRIIKGDVAKVCKNLGKFDRIVMPLALKGREYLDLAFKCAVPKGIIHFYTIAPEEDLWSEAEQFAYSIAKKVKKNIEIIGRKRVLPWGSRAWKICLDIKVL
jgi:tRNA (guanine37-N1)-methyltransferase